MKTPTLQAFTLLLVLLGIVCSTAEAQKGATTSISATLILASNEPGETDSRLHPYESTLRRIFNFGSYRQIGRGSTRISSPGDGSLSLGSGQELLISLPETDNSSIRAKVHWRRDGRTLIHTTVAMKPGVPTLLGGPHVKGGNGNLIVVLVAD